jgi:hypothetical protein
MYDTEVSVDPMTGQARNARAVSRARESGTFRGSDRGILRSDLPKNPQTRNAKIQKDWHLWAGTRAQAGMGLA